MAFGYGPGNEMQKSVKGNRSLLGKRKSLKDLRKENGPFSGGPIKLKEASPEEMEAFRAKLKKQQKKERIQVALIFIGSIGLGAFFWYYLTIYKM